MATKYSTQYDNAYNNLVKVGKGDIDGQQRSMYAEFDLDGAAIGIGDIVKLFKLPAGARIVEATVLNPGWGATGEVHLGTAADPDYFIASMTDAAATISKMTSVATHAGIFGQTTAETEVILTGVVATTNTTGVVKVQLDYVLV